ncbi:MAG: hypothetical protein ABJ308_18005 [Halieaceae bacterium]
MTRILTTLALLIVAACSSTPTANPTLHPYEIDRERLQANPIKTVIIAPINLGGPTRKYLREHEPLLDRMVQNYLEEHGYKVLPARAFEQKWKTAMRVYGNPVDPSTGKMNQKSFVQSLVSVRDALMENERPDALVFTELLEQEVPFSGGMKHLARWHGVSRKPTLQGPGDGVSAGFDWNRPAKAASLRVFVYDMDLQRVFTSIGGLDMLQAIDTRSSSGKFVRRRSILENRDHLEEGISLAFYPFIDWKDYPGAD